MAKASALPFFGAKKPKGREASKVTGLNLWFIRKQFTRGKRQKIYAKLARALENGVGLRGALDQAYRRYSRNGTKPQDVSAVALYDWWQGVNNGLPLSIAAKDWVPPNELILLQAGEEASQLPESLHGIVELQKGVGAITTKLLVAMAYPLFVISLILVQFNRFGAELVPQFANTKPVEQWVGVGRAFGDTSLFLADYLGLMFLILVIIVAVIGFSLSRWTGKLRARFDSFGPWKIFRLLNSISVLMALSTMQRAGQGEVDSLKAFIQIAHPWLKERLVWTLRQVSTGKLLGQAFVDSPLNFPDLEIRYDVEFYSNMADLDDSLSIIAREALIEGQERSERLGRLLSMAALFLAGAGALFLFVGFQNMAGQIQTN